MLNIKTEPTTSEKVKEAALAVADLAAAKASDMKDKATNDIAPAIADKAADARDALAPHFETVRDAAQPHIDAVREAAQPHVDAVRDAAQPHVDHAIDIASTKRDEALDKAAEVRDAAVARQQEIADEAQKRSKKAQKQASKKAGKAQKRVCKKADKAQKQADKKVSRFQKKADRKFTDTFGVSDRQDVSYKAAALRGQAQAFAEDKGLTADQLRETYSDEIAPQLKEIVAALTAAAATAQKQTRQGAQQAVAYLPDDAQKYVAQYAPSIAPRKKGGKFLLLSGVAALGGAGYLFYANQKKQQRQTAQLSEAAIADSRAQAGDNMTINNPVTNFQHADDTTVVKTAGEAGGPGTAATWEDTDASGDLTTRDLEGEPSTRREAREGK